jgi:hypothetical protein
VVPIQNISLTLIETGLLGLTFDYPVRPRGFNHAHIAIVERDGSRDVWSIKPRNAPVAGSPPNVLSTQRYSFYNETYGRWLVTPTNTSGNADDFGSRHYVIDLDLHRSGDRVTLRFPYGYQVDPDANLEFYAIIAIVAVVGDDVPCAVLGEMAYSAERAGVPIP